MEPLDCQIIGCTECPATLVEYRWTPISYFGEIGRANAWTVSINPSAREFTDTRGNDLTGQKQRFARIADFPDCRSRQEVAAQHLDEVLEMQRTVLERAPYRNYFNRLGKFILLAHGRQSAADPLAPFTEGLASGRSKRLFCHLDIAKCATRAPWSDLNKADQRTLLKNCSRYLEEQIRSSSPLKLILINGRTAFNECLDLMNRLGFDGIQQRVPLGGSTTSIISGTLRSGGRKVKVVAWTANVVNGRLTVSDLQALAQAVRAAILDHAAA